MAGAPAQVQPDELLLAFRLQQQASTDAVSWDPLSCSGPGDEAMHILSLVFPSCRPDLPSYYCTGKSPLQSCRDFRDFAWSPVCAAYRQLSRATVCACFATGMCVGSVTLECWVISTSSSSALLLQISGTVIHRLQTDQVSWLGLCGPETSPWSAGVSWFAFLECAC